MYFFLIHRSWAPSIVAFSRLLSKPPIRPKILTLSKPDFVLPWKTPLKIVFELTCCSKSADPKWITEVSWITGAAWIVISYRAFGMGATHSRTGILALIGYASQVSGALLVEGALWLALCVRVSLQTRKTDTCSCIVSVPAFCINTARRWIAWVNNLRCRARSWKFYVLNWKMAK